MINIFEYKYGTDKGAAHRGQTFASPLGYQGMNSEYTTSAITGEIIPSDHSGDYTPAFGPVKGGKVFVNGTEVALVNGAIPSASATAGASVDYFYDNESVPVQTPQIMVNIKSLPIETKSRKLSAVWAFDAQYELSKEYGADMQQLLANQASAEIEQEIDNEITLDLLRIANAAPKITWSKTQPVGVNIVDHYDSFWNKVVEGSNEIFKATRKARANFMVCGLGVDAVLKTMRNFDAAEDMTAVGPHFIGTLGGSIKCYVNPNYDANKFVLGYKGNNFMDAGYVYAPYMPVMTTGMITLADDFAAREGWATTYGTKVVNPKLYVAGEITD